MFRGGGPPPCECVDVAELTVGGGTDPLVADTVGEIGAALQQHCAFVVVAADRVHQGRSELEQARSHELFVVAALGVVGRSPQAFQAGVHGSRRDGGTSGLEH